MVIFHTPMLRTQPLRLRATSIEWWESYFFKEEMYMTWKILRGLYVPRRCSKCKWDIQVDDNAFTMKTLKETGLIYTCIYIIHLPRLRQLAWLRYYWFLGWNLKVIMHPARKKKYSEPGSPGRPSSSTFHVTQRLHLKFSLFKNMATCYVV